MFRAILAWLLTNEKWDEIIFERAIKRLFLIFIIVHWELTRDSEFCVFNLSEKLFFVTTNPEHEAAASLDGMFKFLAAQETDMVKETTIR